MPAARRKSPSVKPGRPTDYTPETGDMICARLAQGDSLNSICKGDSFPSTVTVYAWLRKHEEFLSNYMRAREDQADTHADEIIGIADNSSAEEVNKARLQVDARKWVASKLKPKKYGDKLEHSGPNGGPAFVVQVVKHGADDPDSK